MSSDSWQLCNPLNIMVEMSHLVPLVSIEQFKTDFVVRPRRRFFLIQQTTKPNPE